jgi:hypothetical protein
MAILCRGTHDILIEGNRLDGCQIKLSGPKGGGPGIRVIGNYGTNCHNYGLSVVTAKRNVCEDVIVTGNVFAECWAGGIYIGSDGDKDKGGQFRRCIVTNNICTSKLPNKSVPLRARAGQVAEDWIITGNTCRGTDKRTRAAFGIDVSRTDTEGNMSRLVVANNTVTECDLQGINIVLKNGNCSITGNVVDESRGIEVSVKKDSTVTVTGNNVRSRVGYPGLALKAERGATMDLSVAANFLPGGLITEGEGIVRLGGNS